MKYNIIKIRDEKHLNKLKGVFKMKKITAKFITENLNEMMCGKRVEFRGALYFAKPVVSEDGFNDIKNGTIYRISEDERILGSVQGTEYGKVIDGVPYKY